MLGMGLPGLFGINGDDIASFGIAPFVPADGSSTLSRNSELVVPGNRQLTELRFDFRR
jgi:hypothetical protein